MGHTPQESVDGVLISLSRPWAGSWINHLILWCITAPWPVPNDTAWWQRHVCEQLAQGCYLKVEWPEVEPATFCIASQHPNHYTIRPDVSLMWILLLASCFDLNEKYGYTSRLPVIVILLTLGWLTASCRRFRPPFFCYQLTCFVLYKDSHFLSPRTDSMDLYRYCFFYLCQLFVFKVFFWFTFLVFFWLYVIDSSGLCQLWAYVNTVYCIVLYNGPCCTAYH